MEKDEKVLNSEAQETTVSKGESKKINVVEASGAEVLLKVDKYKIKNSYARQGLMFFLTGAALILTYYAVNHFDKVQAGISKINSTLLPFYLGLIFAYLLCPIYNACMRIFAKLFAKNGVSKPQRTISKVMATIICVIVIFVVITGLVMLVVPDMIESIMSLIPKIEPAFDRAVIWVEKNLSENEWLSEFVENRLNNIEGTVVDWAQNKLLPNAEAFISKIASGVVGTVSTIANILIAIFICIYVLNSKETFLAQTKKIILAIFKKERADKIFEFGQITNSSFGGFINGKIIDSIIVGIICFIAMKIMNIPLTLLVSVIVGITNIIPFFGPLIGAVPCAFFLLILDPMACLKFVIMTIILQQIDGNIIGPKILGKTTKLASFWVMFSIIVFGKYLGLFGMIIGVPCFAVIYTYIARAVNSKLKKRGLETNTASYVNDSMYEPGPKKTLKERINGYFNKFKK